MPCNRCKPVSDNWRVVCDDCRATIEQQIECLKNCYASKCPSIYEPDPREIIQCGSGINWRLDECEPIEPRDCQIRYWCYAKNHECLEKWLNGSHFCSWCWRASYSEFEGKFYVLMLGNSKLIKNAYNFGAYLFI